MLLITNGYIKTISSKDIENGFILINDNGKIQYIGETAPNVKCENVIDAGGRLVTPGLVEAHCHIGLKNTAVGWESIDHNEKSDPITPHLRAIDGINPQDEAFGEAIKCGVTSACTGPGSANVVGGTFAAIKLYGKRVDKMIIKNPVAMKCAFGENPKNFYGQSSKKAPFTRMATAGLLRELLIKTQNYINAKESGKEPALDIKLEAMIPVLKKEIPLKAHAHRADDILTAIRIAKEFDVKLTLDHCTDGSIIADELAEEGYPALVGPSFGHKTKIELMGKSFTTPATLHKHGVPISIITDSPVIPLQHLAMCAGFAVSSGLDVNEAWNAITINPATQMGISDRVGSLDVGKDGDVVIWSQDPLSVIGATAYMTIIDGKIVHREDK